MTRIDDEKADATGDGRSVSVSRDSRVAKFAFAFFALEFDCSFHPSWRVAGQSATKNPWMIRESKR